MVKGIWDKRAKFIPVHQENNNAAKVIFTSCSYDHIIPLSHKLSGEEVCVKRLKPAEGETDLHCTV